MSDSCPLFFSIEYSVIKNHIHIFSEVALLAES